jgi:hypothetical protein
VGTAEIKITGDAVNVCVNGCDVPVNVFAGKIIKNTIYGMVSTLKGVSEINKLQLSIKK